MCYVCLSVEGRRCSGEVRSMILRGGGNGPFKVPRFYLGPGMNLLQPRTRICGPVSALTSQTPRLSRRFDIVSGFVQKKGDQTLAASLRGKFEIIHTILGYFGNPCVCHVWT